MNPYGIPQVYATGGTDNLWGDDPDLSPGVGSVFSTHPSTYDGQIVSKPLKVPRVPASSASSTHSASTARGVASTNHDGGRVEYTVNAGAAWVDAGPLFTNNGYGFNTGGTANSRLAGDNPLAGASRVHPAQPGLCRLPDLAREPRREDGAVPVPDHH